MHVRTAVRITVLAACLVWGGGPRAQEIMNFPFNEGSGDTTTDVANGYVGVFAGSQDPLVDRVELDDFSPSGAAGDRSINVSGQGFLLADDSENQVLDIREGPITMETWVLIDPSTIPEAAEGILAYGGSYKLGLRQGELVFTLYGIVDIVNAAAGVVPAGDWVHLAAAWDPGVGVHFYVNGEEYFVADANEAARAPLHNYLSLASEGFGNNAVGTFDRMRIHNAPLTAAEIDSDRFNPKAPLPSTIVSYDFDVADFPATNEISPELPTIASSEGLSGILGPSWTSDTPSGAEEDYALSFNLDYPQTKEVIVVDTTSAPLNLLGDNNSYTLQVWVKLPTEQLEERRVIFRSNGQTAPRISLSINANRTLHTTVLGTADFSTNVRLPNDNRWHHIAVVMENFEQLHFYLDGVQRQTVNRTQTNPPNTGGSEQLLIGKESETRYFRGLMDRVIINDSALTQAELDFPAAPGFPIFEAIEFHPSDVQANAGESITLDAIATSATTASYQWYFAPTEGEPGTPVEGATDSTLMLDNVSGADTGFYYLEVTNEAGTTYSYPARVVVAPSLAFAGTGFETPDYVSGHIDEQNFWTTDFGQTARVLTSDEIAAALAVHGITTGETVQSGEQALLVRSSGGVTAPSTTLRRVSGYEDDQNVTVDLWVRPLIPGTSNMGTGNTFLTIENSGGVRAAAFRAGPAGSIDYGTDVQGVWQPTGLLYDGESWYNIRLELDYSTRTYDMFIDGTQVNTTGAIPFYDPDSDSFNQLRIFRGNNQSGILLDNVNIIGEGGGGDGPALTIQEEGDQLVISWPASAEGFTLQATDELVPANWTGVTHETVGAENRAVIEPEGDHRFFRLVR